MTFVKGDGNMQQAMNNLALICGDGGAKGGFIAGAVTALLEEFPDKLLNVKSIVASSASVGSMCYFISHALDHPGRKIWIEENSSKAFIKYESIGSLFGERPIYDIDHLVYTTFKRNYPLNQEKIKNSPIKFFFPVQNYSTHKIEYFSNAGDGEFWRDGQRIPIHDMAPHDIYDLIRASNAAPFVYDRSVKIRGKEYMDAATLEPFALDLPSLKGSKKILIVTKHDRTLKRKLTYGALGVLWPLLVNPFRKEAFSRQIYWQYAMKPLLMDRRLREAEELARAGELLLIAPEARLGSNFDNSLETMSANFKNGEDAVRRRKGEIWEFLKDISSV